MNILRSMKVKSGDSRAQTLSRKNGRKMGILAVSVAALGLSACSGALERLSEIKVPPMDVPFATQQVSSATAIDRRVWQVNDAERFAGLVVADEPQAAEVGRNILASGGNAADAAVGVYFSLAATYPGAAGLGGGGACLYDGPGDGGVQQIDFPVKPAKAGGKVGVPGNIRGFAWLHANHGEQTWAQVVAPAARLAGNATMSNATTSQLEANRSLRWVPEGMKTNGDFTPVGRRYSQPALSATIGLIQGSGAGVFYNGALGQTFVEEARRSDSKVTRDDLRAYVVKASAARMQTSGNNHVFTRNGSPEENSVWTSAIDGSKPLDADMNSLRSGDAGSTSFVVADDEGGAVACVVSMNSAFGFGDVSRTTGIYFSSAQDATSLSNMVMVKSPGRGLIYAGASGGGASGLQKSAATVSEVVLMKIATLEGALRHNQNSGFDPVNAFSCDKGLTQDATSCRFGSEPSSNGYGLLAE